MANRLPPLSRVSLETLTAERADLYTHVTPPGRPIPIEVAPFQMDENILGEEDISEAMLRPQLHRFGGPSGMKAKQLRMWLCAKTREEDPKLVNWEKFVAIIQEDFRGG